MPGQIFVAVRTVNLAAGVRVPFRYVFSVLGGGQFVNGAGEPVQPAPADDDERMLAYVRGLTGAEGCFARRRIRDELYAVHDSSVRVYVPLLKVGMVALVKFNMRDPGLPSLATPEGNLADGWAIHGGADPGVVRCWW